ncbi:methylthioribose-1-phosphate isomerase, partial [bacterium SM23_31]
FAIEQMKEILNRYDSSDATQIKQEFLAEADRLYHEDADLCRRIGEFGAELIKDGASVITHCNTGMLVTAGIGTALGVIFTAVAQGKKIHVYADETRPLLQGARLTTWECMNRGVPVTLICDGAAADVLRRGKANCGIVGADRIAANGDVANKIGTYSLAVNCRAHNVPFYVAAPYSTFDFSINSGDEIPIEERSSAEVTKPFGVIIAPEGIPVFNPAFDLTPAEFVTAFITDAGIFRPPYGKWENLKTP